MKVELRITNPTPDSEFSLLDFEYEHVGCVNGLMRRRRDPVNNTVSVQCGCGQRLDFPQMGEASSVIIAVSIDSEIRLLPKGSYRSAPECEVIVSSGNAG
jgi:hypothetical protein